MIIFVYIGILAGAFMSVYLFDLTNYLELFSDHQYCLFVCIINFIQISILITIASIIAKRYRFVFFRSCVLNFIIGLLFSLLYFLTTTFVTPKVSYLDTTIFIMVVLPIVIFTPLIIAEYSVYKLIKKGELRRLKGV